MCELTAKDKRWVCVPGQNQANVTPKAIFRALPLAELVSTGLDIATPPSFVLLSFNIVRRRNSKLLAVAQATLVVRLLRRRRVVVEEAEGRRRW
ncbi:hypothetical protein TWF694_005598 [Orbilia ellipsospora]|uniref:Uncharacterized protein n=1 Tax=Orbilia ellipsospora TaxID=2528407 RepID=A0AAV9WW18_9PEZI